MLCYGSRSRVKYCCSRASVVAATRRPIVYHFFRDKISFDLFIAIHIVIVLVLTNTIIQCRCGKIRLKHEMRQLTQTDPYFIHKSMYLVCSANVDCRRDSRGPRRDSSSYSVSNTYLTMITNSVYIAKSK